MMSTPQQLKVMQEKLADTLQTLMQNKARLVEECQALQADQENREQEHMERKQDVCVKLEGPKISFVQWIILIVCHLVQEGVSFSVI